MPHKPMPRFEEATNRWRVQWKGEKVTLAHGRDHEEEAWAEAYRLSDGAICREGNDPTRPHTVAELIKSWLRHRSLDDHSPQARWLGLWSDLEGKRRLADLSSDYLEGWRDWLTNRYHQAREIKRHPVRSRHYGRPLSPTTVRHYVLMAWQVIKYGVKKKWIVERPDEPMELPKLPRPRKGHKDIPLDRLQEAMAELENPTVRLWTCKGCGATLSVRGKGAHKRRCTGRGYKPTQDRTMQAAYAQSRKKVRHARVLPLLKMALFCGARPDEVCLLHWSEVDLVGNKCLLPEDRVKTGDSAGTQRTVPLNPQAKELLESLPHRTGYVFTSRLGRPYKPAGVRTILNRFGISGMYALRHTFAQSAMDQGFPLEIVSKWLGHTSVETTRIYCEVRDPRAIQAAQNLYLPLPARPGDPCRSPAPRLSGDGLPGGGATAPRPTRGGSGNDRAASVA